ncbi:MAG TPA: FAD-dependent oxidoreductase [Cyclobacteriaceae bacterium]|jgi:D-amino-acid dehydrogenase|nr:FAD-dependent oxidoreductase [Cyclobacteriaceae bacterium]
MNVAIIGGGIIGLSSAYYLQQSGHHVTIFDQGDGMDNCSTGNAGMIVPSHIIPLAAPGMISKGVRWMFNSQSPFYVKPRLNGNLIKWGYQFYKHANQENVDHAIPALKDISMFSKAMYQRMVRDNPFEFGYQERGLMMLYQTKETEKEELETAHIANKNGVEAHVLTLQEIQKLEPDVKVSARGGVYFPGDAHLIPQQLVTNLISYLKENGVTFYTNTTVTDFVSDEKGISVIVTSKGTLDFDHYVLAAGAWSGIFSSKLGIDLPLQGGKGYSFTLDNVERNIRIPSILLEGRVAVTPMGNALRFGGTMEINGVDRSINMNRVKGIVKTIPAYYPEMNLSVPEEKIVWRGLRPCSPDGLPYIGRSDRYKNLVVATGHSMMGLSLAPGTGKLVSELVNNTKTSIDLKPFNIHRYM